MASPSLPTTRGQLLLAQLAQLNQSQWWQPEKLLAQQLRQAGQLLTHACKQTAFYRERLTNAGYAPGQTLTLEAWRQLPVLTRLQIKNAGESLHCSTLPPEHGRIHTTQTSGTTGAPLRILRTELDTLIWMTTTLRDHGWHGRDVMSKLASIRKLTAPTGAPPHGTEYASWGRPFSQIGATGRAVMLNQEADLETRAAWLMAQQPDYLHAYPSNIKALALHLAARGERPEKLRAVCSLGGTVTADLRALVRELWQVPITDVYSAQELGYVALQCPESGLYHLMAESLLVEVLNSANQPCTAGEIGRLVITNLHGYATPLIRYELGDLAEVGEPCTCGRGLPTLRRILGRSVNMVILPDGRQHWPFFNYAELYRIASVVQFQLQQRAPEEIELRLACRETCNAGQTDQLRSFFQQALEYPFRLNMVFFKNELPAGRGKLEEFISTIPPS